MSIGCGFRDDFDDDRAVGFDRAEVAIESICPVVVEIISKSAKLHDKGVEGVNTLDGTEYSNPIRQSWSTKSRGGSFSDYH